MAFSVFVIFNADRKQLTFRLLDILIGQVPYNTKFSWLTKRLHASETWPDEPDFSHLMIRKTKETELKVFNQLILWSSELSNRSQKSMFFLITN